MLLSCHREDSRFFLTNTNADKTIKLWKVFDKAIKVVAETNTGVLQDSGPAFHTRNPKPSQPLKAPLKLPKLVHHDTITAAIPRKIYQNAHAYHINSISVNSDGETYLSADDLRVNLWNLGISDQSFSKLL
jgi:serine/threonine-protein phosphatase 2A regulatory subunit B